MDKPYDPIQMQRAIALMKYFLTLPDRGILLLSNIKNMTDIVYVYLYGNLYDSSGEAFERADQILENYVQWKAKIENLDKIPENSRSEVENAMLMVALDRPT
ncbi:MAG: hypothetical protein R2877_08470 [Bdellovibrionota bacterium]